MSTDPNVSDAKAIKSADKAFRRLELAAPPEIRDDVRTTRSYLHALLDVASGKHRDPAKIEQLSKDAEKVASATKRIDAFVTSRCGG